MRERRGPRRRAPGRVEQSPDGGRSPAIPFKQNPHKYLAYENLLEYYYLTIHTPLSSRGKRYGIKAMTRQEFYWPPPVAPGEVVAVAAPASHVSRPPWEAGMNILRDWGFRVRCGPEVFQPRAYGAATDRLMARRFEEIWLDPEVKAVLAVRGGLWLPEAVAPPESGGPGGCAQKTGRVQRPHQSPLGPAPAP